MNDGTLSRLRKCVQSRLVLPALSSAGIKDYGCNNDNSIQDLSGPISRDAGMSLILGNSHNDESVSNCGDNIEFLPKHQR